MKQQVLNADKFRIVSTCMIYRFIEGKFHYHIRKRAVPSPLEGLWEVSGGNVEFGDFLHQLEAADFQEGYPRHEKRFAKNVLAAAARREVWQETRLEVGEFFYVDDYCHYRESEKILVMVVCFAAPYRSGIAVLDDEATQQAWITADQVANYKFVGNIPEDMRKVDEFLKKKLEEKNKTLEARSV